MILVFVTSPSGPAALAPRSTARLCSYPARGSRTRFCSRSTVSTLCAKTSNPEFARCATADMSPWKSGVRHSARMSGRSSLSVRTVRAKCSAPPSGMSSRSTEVSTNPAPHSAPALACFRLHGIQGGVCAVLTAQKRHPRVQVSPRIMMWRCRCRRSSTRRGWGTWPPRTRWRARVRGHPPRSSCIARRRARADAARGAW